MLAFCYGTLKRGYRNNYFLETATFVGEGQTVAKFRMYDSGFPVLRPRRHRQTDTTGATAPVRGEVYEIDETTLARMDRLENEGHMYHRRKGLIRLDSGQLVTAWYYVGSAEFWKNRLREYPEPSGAYDWPIQRRAAG